MIEHVAQLWTQIWSLTTVYYHARLHVMNRL